MNKLPVSTVKIAENLDVLKITEPNTIFEIEGQVKINALQIETTSFHSLWKVLENASLCLGTVLELNNTNGRIEIESYENSQVVLQLGISAKGKNSFFIQNKLLESSIHNRIKLRVVGDLNSHTKIKATGLIEAGTKENEFLEDVKYLMEENNYIECLPELLVSSEDSVANHFMSIGCILEEELFYFGSKGICEDSAKELIRKSFLTSMRIGEEE